MFDAQHSDSPAHPLRLTPLSQLARDASLGLSNERSYMVPVMFWVANGQGRYSIEGSLRGYTSNNVIFLPATLAHSIDISSRCHGTAVFFADRSQLPFPTEPMHLRLCGVQAQTEFAGLIEDLRTEAQGNLPERDTALYHRAALMLLWLRRHSGRLPAHADARVSDMLRNMVASR